MAFFFKSKKNAEKAQGTKDGSNGVAGSQSSFNSSNGRMNEKGAVQQSSTPSSSVNNSMNSLQGGGTATPSPEQVNGRRGPSSEQTSDLPVRELPLDFARRAFPSLVQYADSDSYGMVLRLQSNR
jgi:hypothetical protein